jgi:hypothetical protein
MSLPLSERLSLKLEVAADLYRDGKISRAECFKHEVAVSVQKDPGPIVLGGYDPNSDDRSPHRGRR